MRARDPVLDSKMKVFLNEPISNSSLFFSSQYRSGGFLFGVIFKRLSCINGIKHRNCKNFPHYLYSKITSFIPTLKCFCFSRFLSRTSSWNTGVWVVVKSYHQFYNRTLTLRLVNVHIFCSFLSIEEMQSRISYLIFIFKKRQCIITRKVRNLQTVCCNLSRLKSSA